MRKISRLLAILFGIPMLCSLLLPMEESAQWHHTKTAAAAGFLVIVETQQGYYSYEPEALLPYLMAAMLGGQQGGELYQAAAVICRTNLFYAWQNGAKPDSLYLSDAGMSCILPQERGRTDGWERLFQAAEATQGLVLTYEGEVIYAPYFYMSAGSTRSGALPYLKSAACSDNLTNEQYLQQYDFPKAQFYAVLEELGGWEDIKALSQLTLEREDGGYVTAVRAQGEAAYIGAEQLAGSLSLPSLCFTWDEGAESIRIRTRGVGHGWGFDVYYGARLAAQGENYQDILSYFYDGILLEKVY